MVCTAASTRAAGVAADVLQLQLEQRTVDLRVGVRRERRGVLGASAFLVAFRNQRVAANLAHLRREGAGRFGIEQA